MVAAYLYILIDQLIYVHTLNPYSNRTVKEINSVSTTV